MLIQLCCHGNQCQDVVLGGGNRREEMRCRESGEERGEGERGETREEVGRRVEERRDQGRGGEKSREERRREGGRRTG